MAFGMYPCVCKRCLRFWQLILAWLCYKCQRFWQCILACATGVKGFESVPDYVLQVSRALTISPVTCYRCQRLWQDYVLQVSSLWQCAWLCFTCVKGFDNVPEYVIHVSKALAMCLIMCSRCQWIWQCVWLCVTGVKGFNNVPDYVLLVLKVKAMHPSVLWVFKSFGNIPWSVVSYKPHLNWKENNTSFKEKCTLQNYDKDTGASFIC